MDKQRGLFKRFFASKSFLLVGLVVLMLLGFAFGRAYYQNYKLNQEIRDMLDRAAKFQSANGELKNTLQRITSADYVKQVARENMNLVESGENVTVIVGGKRSGSGQQGSAVVESKNNSNPLLWWNYFFNH